MQRLQQVFVSSSPQGPANKPQGTCYHGNLATQTPNQLVHVRDRLWPTLEANGNRTVAEHRYGPSDTGV